MNDENATQGDRKKPNQPTEDSKRVEEKEAQVQANEPSGVQEPCVRNEETSQTEHNAKGQAENSEQNKDAQVLKDAQMIEELKSALARALADLQNFKRRSEEDRGRFIKFANLELLKSLLPILNNLQRSVDHLPEELKENIWSKGVVGIYHDMSKTLEKIGVKKIETVGQPLNPKFHEAVMSGPGEKDKITEEFEAGYLYYEEVIWPAKVKVGDGT